MKDREKTKAKKASKRQEHLRKMKQRFPNYQMDTTYRPGFRPGKVPDKYRPPGPVNPDDDDLPQMRSFVTGEP